MTDLLLKPDDTGDIPAAAEVTARINNYLALPGRVDEVGEGTRNLAPYVAGLGPALRRPEAVLDLIDACVLPNGDLAGPDQPPPPRPLPAPGPPPKPAYVGRHRREEEDVPAEEPPARVGWLRSVLSAGWALVRRSM
jgi:hypothetical protein